jgi:hypothetical protein
MTNPTEHNRFMDQVLEKHIEDEQRHFEDFDKRLEAIEISLVEFKDAWTQAKGVISFVKILAAIAAACATAYAFLTSNFTVIVK